MTAYSEVCKINHFVPTELFCKHYAPETMVTTLRSVILSTVVTSVQNSRQLDKHCLIPKSDNINGSHCDVFITETGPLIEYLFTKSKAIAKIIASKLIN